MEQVEFVVGNENVARKMLECPAWKPFDQRVVEYCDKLSSLILQRRESKNYPDLLTLAFWLRKSNILSIKKNYFDLDNRLGRGLVFHIAPGNIALAFAYSLATGLLTGNTNILRIPSRRFAQADLFCEILSESLYQEDELTFRYCLIRYPHDKRITDAISAICHTRIIWGGDNTINTIRQSAIPPRATEITFADRFSACLIDADRYLSDYDYKKTAHDFYIDTYLTDQNACSSPRIILWGGAEKDKAKKIFWDALCDEISDYPIAAVTIVNKLLNYCKYAANYECKLLVERDCRVMRVELKSLNKAALVNLGNSGFFYEYDVTDLNEILPICNWKLQTLSCIGFDISKLRDFILQNAPEGVDRVVPVGHTMDFGLQWDGRDVIREMTRLVVIQ